uniref:Neur_chan_LBD domain-containing protein n=2 Tax=Macrostomum lignano TaxID=282301 RepID=A0A1I8IXG1_9PLAT
MVMDPAQSLARCRDLVAEGLLLWSWRRQIGRLSGPCRSFTVTLRFNLTSNASPTVEPLTLLTEWDRRIVQHPGQLVGAMWDQSFQDRDEFGLLALTSFIGLGSRAVPRPHSGEGKVLETMAIVAEVAGHRSVACVPDVADHAGPDAVDRLADVDRAAAAAAEHGVDSVDRVAVDPLADGDLDGRGRGSRADGGESGVRLAALAQPGRVARQEAELPPPCRVETQLRQHLPWCCTRFDSSSVQAASKSTIREHLRAYLMSWDLTTPLNVRLGWNESRSMASESHSSQWSVLSSSSGRTSTVDRAHCRFRRAADLSRDGILKMKFLSGILVNIFAIAIAMVAVEPLEFEEASSSDEMIWNLLQLGRKYNKAVRPPPDYNTTNVVYINFIVVKLLGINEVAQHMSLEGFTEMEWNDYRLAWYDRYNGTFNHITAIYLPRSSIWIPDVITINTVEHKESSQPLSAIVLADGRVFTSSPFNTRTLCDINMLYFPFDTQVCRVVFGSWLMVRADLELRVLNKNASSVLAPDTLRQQNIESDEYCITKSDFWVTPVTDLGACQEAVFTIVIQRKPLFYVMNLIMPSFLILIICAFSFFLPPDTGDRLSLNITLMLTLMVFMQIVAGYTPAQSDSVPMLTRFFAIVVAISAVSTLGSVFQLYCCYRGHEARSSSGPMRTAQAACCSCRAGRDRKNNTDSARGTEVEVIPHADASQAAGENLWLVIGRRLDWILFVAMVTAISSLVVFICHFRNPDYLAC